MVTIWVKLIVLSKIVLLTNNLSVRFDTCIAHILPELSSPLTTRCLSAPCPSDQWCEYVSSNSSNFTCMKPAGFYCSFDNASCQWQNLSHNINFWRIYNEYGSLRHDHTGNSCAGIIFGLSFWKNWSTLSSYTVKLGFVERIYRALVAVSFWSSDKAI